MSAAKYPFQAFTNSGEAFVVAAQEGSVMTMVVLVVNPLKRHSPFERSTKLFHSMRQVVSASRGMDSLLGRDELIERRSSRAVLPLMV